MNPQIFKLKLCMTILMGMWTATAQGAPLTRYIITDLGTLPNTTSCRALALNDLGRVVGWCSLSPSGVEPRLGFMWDEGVMTVLGGLPGYPNTTPAAINNHGQVVGTVDDVHSRRPFFWVGGVMNDLNDLLPANSGWELTSASDINDAGQIVGSGYLNGVVRAYLYDGVKIVDIGTLGGSTSGAGGINESGAVVGAADTEDGDRHAFLWQDGVMTQLGPFNGDYSAARDVNDDGAVIGVISTITKNPPLPPIESRSLFRWENGVATELDSSDLSNVSLWAINNLSQVVGSGDRFQGFYFSVGVRWQDSERYELYELIPPNSGWQVGLGRAEDINNAGQIVGFAWTAPSDGNEHAYLLTPGVPIPTTSEWGLMVMTLLVLIAGAVVLARRRLAIGTSEPLFFLFP